MLGLLINEKEMKEIEYILKREMEEILFDIGDYRIDYIVRHTMEERYKILFQLLIRIATPSECTKYILKQEKKNK
jgi:hypothetical protein